MQQQRAEMAPIAEVETETELIDPRRVLVATRLAKAVAGVSGTGAEIETAAVIFVGELTQDARPFVAAAGPDPAAHHPVLAEEIGATRDQALLVVLQLAVGLDRELVGDAVAVRAAGQGRAIVEALAAVVAAHAAELVAEIVQTLLQQPRADIVGLGHQLLAPEQIGHPQLDLAGAGDRGQAFQRERPRRYRARLALDVVDEHVDHRSPAAPSHRSSAGER